MKKMITVAVVLLTAVLGVNAQDYDTPNNEIAVGVGFGTHPFIGVGLASAIIDAFEDGSDTATGAYSVTYLRNLNSHIAIGATGVYEYMYSKDTDGKKTSDSFITVMPTARAYWFRGGMVGMYSRLAAGVSLSLYEDYKDGSTTELENKSEALFAFHVAPVCVEIGSDKFSGFFELGYGYQGLVNAGVKIGF